MALARIRSRLTSSPAQQPPSPMPNSRANNPPFNNHVDKLKNIPEFDLPDDMNRSPIADVEYRLIKLKDKKSIQRMWDSAVKFGVFKVSGHGISPEELQLAFNEAEYCFGLLAERWSRDGDREEFAWSRSAMVVAERRRDVKSSEEFQLFRQKMDSLANKLEAIAKDVAQIMGSNGGKQPRKKIKENETRMTLFKHSNSSLQPHTPRSCQTPRSLEGSSRRDSATFAFSLHVPTEFGEFRLLSEERSLSFRTDPNTIVFTIGEQVEEWSYGEFRSTMGEINIEPDVQEDKGAYSIELKCSPSILNEAVDKNESISITEQIIFVAIVAIIYKLFSYLLS
ncbi:gibberellin 2-beta-dioxygenase 8-like [Rutidosis leptorrhynchoides]|uniref:gibberellin 2-beta-dioxygenase 8-like n=1 Tax=Rutidosis leptorrhynchoides TaxID=125765 RepID=UPI003A9A1301